MPSKKSATKKTTSKKKAAPKKTAARKTAKEKAVAKKTTAKKSAVKKAAKKRSTAAKTGNSNPKKEKKRLLSEFIKRPSHTPTIFKAPSKRSVHVAFSIEDVREILKKRAEEEKLEKAERKKIKTEEKVVPKVLETPKIEETTAQKKSHHAAASLDDILGLSSGSSGSSTSTGTIPRKFQKYHKLLIELRDQVRDELNLHSNDTLKRSQKEDAGDISISADAGTDNFDRDFALSLLSSEQEALNEIEDAIQRIYKGTYGKCEVTGEPIKAERLEAVPFTRFSVEGQKAFEQNTRKRVSTTGAFLNEASGEKITFGDDDGDN